MTEISDRINGARINHIIELIDMLANYKSGGPAEFTAICRECIGDRMVPARTLSCNIGISPEAIKKWPEGNSLPFPFEYGGIVIQIKEYLETLIEGANDN